MASFWPSMSTCTSRAFCMAVVAARTLKIVLLCNIVECSFHASFLFQVVQWKLRHCEVRHLYNMYHGLRLHITWDEFGNQESIKCVWKTVTFMNLDKHNGILLYILPFFAFHLNGRSLNDIQGLDSCIWTRVPNFRSQSATATSSKQNCWVSHRYETEWFHNMKSLECLVRYWV